jgi:hypothetical protein
MTLKYVNPMAIMLQLYHVGHDLHTATNQQLELGSLLLICIETDVMQGVQKWHCKYVLSSSGTAVTPCRMLKAQRQKSCMQQTGDMAKGGILQSPTATTASTAAGVG